MPTPQGDAPRRVFALIPLAVGIAAVALAWPVISVNLTRGCVVKDTPYLPLCLTSPESADSLRARLAANPGETPAYIELAALAPHTSALTAAQRLAPTQPQVMLMKATQALKREDLAGAIPSLIDLTENHGNDAAAQVLARLVAGGKAVLLEPYLRPGSMWPVRVLYQMKNSGGEMSSALPLVSKALAAKALDPAAVASFVAQMKGVGAWGDAYALWLTLHGRPLPMLYNGSFDEPFLAEGFDWEFNTQTSASRAGAIVDRIGAEVRGAILDVRLTGRTIATPMIRQYVFTGPGRYRLKGDYRTRQLRLDKGLAWTIRCTAETVKDAAGASGALLDTGDAWKPFAFEFALPPECGPVVTVQLEPVSPADAIAGGHGEAWFDALSLERLAN